MPIGHVLSVFEDSHDFIWLGTDDGLCRFDGINCKIYKHDEKDSASIKGTRIDKILEDKDGNLWIFSDEALNCYLRGEDDFNSYSIHQNSSSNNFIYSAALWLNDTVMFLNSTDLKFYLFNIHSKKFAPAGIEIYPAIKLQQLKREGKHIAVVPNKSVHGISVWYLNEEKKLTHYDYFTKQTGSFITANAFGQIITESDSLVWINCEKGLIAFNPVAKSYLIYKPAAIKGPAYFTLMFSQSNELLIGSRETGLWVFDTRQKKFIANYTHDITNPESLSGNNISDAGLLDNNNNLWIEVFAKGIDYVNLNEEKFTHYLAEKEARGKGLDNFIRCMAEDSAGNVWCGTLRNHLYVFNKQKELVADYSKNIVKGNSSTVVYLFRDQQNRMWVVNNQLYVFHGNTKTFESIPEVHTVINIIQLHDGTIIFTEWHDGIYKVKDNAGKLSVEPTAIKGLFNERQAIYEDQQQRLYINAPDLSLNVYSSPDKSTPIQVLKIHAEVKSFYESPGDSTLCIATSQGLMKLNKNNFNYSFITTKNGLPNDFVYSVLPDKKENL